MIDKLNDEASRSHYGKKKDKVIVDLPSMS